jgi:hypothetical protein
VLSQEHAFAKYAGRVFAPGDLRKGWHGNRLDLDAVRLRLPDSSLLQELVTWDSREFDRTRPHTTHFWDWDQPTTPGSAPYRAAEARR